MQNVKTEIEITTSRGSKAKIKIFGNHSLTEESWRKELEWFHNNILSLKLPRREAKAN